MEERQEELVSSFVTSCNEQLITIVHCAIRPTLTPRLNIIILVERYNDEVVYCTISKLRHYVQTPSTNLYLWTVKVRLHPSLV